MHFIQTRRYTVAPSVADVPATRLRRAIIPALAELPNDTLGVMNTKINGARVLVHIYENTNFSVGTSDSRFHRIWQVGQPARESVDRSVRMVRLLH